MSQFRLTTYDTARLDAVKTAERIRDIAEDIHVAAFLNSLRDLGALVEAATAQLTLLTDALTVMETEQAARTVRLVPKPATEEDAAPRSTVQRGTLTDDQVRDIRQRREDGATFPTLAKEFGVTVDSVAAVAKRQTYKHVPDIVVAPAGDAKE